MKPQIFWYNGTLYTTGKIELAIDDPGLIYGATVFTTLRVYQQSLDHPLTAWAGHCDRLRINLQSFGWQQPNWHRLQQGAETLIEYFPVLRMVVFADGREWITGRPLPADLATKQAQGITAWLAIGSQFQRSLVTHKTGNYLPTWLALQAAQQQGAQEAILTDSQENWLESSTGNLWGWQDGCWWTPPLEAGILPGLVRSHLIHWFKCQNEKVQEEPWQPDLIKKFKAIAYANSVVEVVPIHTVLGSVASFSYDPHHFSFQQLRRLFTS